MQRKTARLPPHRFEHVQPAWILRSSWRPPAATGWPPTKPRQRSTDGSTAPDCWPLPPFVSASMRCHTPFCKTMISDFEKSDCGPDQPSEELDQAHLIKLRRGLIRGLQRGLQRQDLGGDLVVVDALDGVEHGLR